MIGIVVAAHGDLADALVKMAQSVVTAECPIVAVGIFTDDDAAAYDARLRDAVTSVQKGDGVLMLTDMFGGTPSNIGLTLHAPGDVEVLTGANLPMLIKAMQFADKGIDLTTVSREVKEYGQHAIAMASEVLGLTGEPTAGGSES